MMLDCPTLKAIGEVFSIKVSPSERQARVSVSSDRRIEVLISQPHSIALGAESRVKSHMTHPKLRSLPVEYRIELKEEYTKMLARQVA
jgi:hypothetical protein